MDNELSHKTCIPCSKGTTALKGEQLHHYHEKLEGGWHIVEEHHLEKTYPFRDFADALAFVNKVGEIAEKEGHHPDIHLSYGRVKIQFWTHKIDGLSESDFILAAKCDTIK